MLMGHCHLFPGGFGEARADEHGVPGTAEHLFAFMTPLGFTSAQVISPIENPEDDTVSARIDGEADGVRWLLSQPHVGTDPDAALLPAAAIAPHRPDALSKLHRAIALGVRMLKFHPIIMRCDPLDPVCEPFWRAAAEAQMPVTWHTGGGDWGWTAEHARPAVAAELARRFEALPILMAHCGMFGAEDHFDEAVRLCHETPNLFLDTTGAFEAAGRDRWKRALDTVTPARVIYGNDYPWVSRESIESELAFIDDLGLTPDEKAGVLGANLLSLIQQ
ncbi:MAG: amidohydrolase family protein [Planctomycetota bacterium]|jgi:predicted TIM-barrel fold metal-dependent hydrolase